jgi:hypothetical protein
MASNTGLAEPVAAQEPKARRNEQGPSANVRNSPSRRLVGEASTPEVPVVADCSTRGTPGLASSGVATSRTGAPGRIAKALMVAEDSVTAPVHIQRTMGASWARAFRIGNPASALVRKRRRVTIRVFGA